MFGFLRGDCPTTSWGGISFFVGGGGFFLDKTSILHELTGEEEEEGGKEKKDKGHSIILNSLGHFPRLFCRHDD